MAYLFVLDLTYVAGLDLIEKHLEEHRAYLAEHYAAGTLLASGPKEPRTGGVIIAQGERAQIDQFIREDPFAINGAARYAVTQFLPTMTAPLLSALKQAPHSD